MTPRAYPRSLGASSAKFGPCGVCGEYATDVHLTPTDPAHYVFGHRECVAPLTDQSAADMLNRRRAAQGKTR